MLFTKKLQVTYFSSSSEAFLFLEGVSLASFFCEAGLAVWRLFSVSFKALASFLCEAELAVWRLFSDSFKSLASFFCEAGLAVRRLFSAGFWPPLLAKNSEAVTSFSCVFAGVFFFYNCNKKSQIKSKLNTIATSKERAIKKYLKSKHTTFATSNERAIYFTVHEGIFAKTASC
jgi:hypothetical protein